VSLNRIPVWPLYFIGTGALCLGLVLVVFTWPKEIPAESELKMYSGEIESLTIRDDISGRQSLFKMPIESVYFKLVGIDGEFRYPSGWPKFIAVRDTVGVALDLWVDPNEIDSGQPILIYQMRERNPFKRSDEDSSVTREVYVSYSEIIEARTRTRQSYFELGSILSPLGLGFIVIGIVLHRVKRRPS